MDEDPGKKDCRGGGCPLKKIRGYLTQTCHRSGGCGECSGKSCAKRTCRIKRSEAPDRFFPVLRPDRCRKNRDLKGTCGGSVWQRTVYDPCWYVGIYGETQRIKDDWFTARICRPWGGRTAQRKGAQKSVFGDPVWWDRKGASGCI